MCKICGDLFVARSKATTFNVKNKCISAVTHNLTNIPTTTTLRYVTSSVQEINPILDNDVLAATSDSTDCYLKYELIMDEWDDSTSSWTSITTSNSTWASSDTYKFNEDTGHLRLKFHPNTVHHRRYKIKVGFPPFDAASINETAYFEVNYQCDTSSNVITNPSLTNPI